MLFYDKKIENESNIAIISSEGEKISYEQLCTEAKRMGCYKVGRKLTCIICDKNIETFSLIFKLFYLGQPMILLSEKTTEEYLRDVLKRFRPDYLWKDKELQEVKSFGKEGRKEIHSEIAVLLSTSGSIGEPKFVKLSYKNLREASYMGIEKFKINKKQKGILTVPIEHVLGLNFCLYHWLTKATLIISSYSVLDKRFQELYDFFEINNFVGIPFLYKMLKKIGFWNSRERVGRLNCALVAGAKLEENLRKYLVELLKEKFIIAYGQTETTGVVVTMAFDLFEDAPDGIIGKPIQGVEAYLFEQELVIKSPTVCMGYALGCKELYVGDENTGEIYTGDIAEIDDNSIIILKGRKKRFVKIMGHRYQLDNIEELLGNTLGEDREFACTGIEDEINIYIQGEMVDKEIYKRIEKKLLENIDMSARMIHVYNVKKIPRSSTGKVLYSKL